MKRGSYFAVHASVAGHAQPLQPLPISLSALPSPADPTPKPIDMSPATDKDLSSNNSNSTETITPSDRLEQGTTKASTTTAREVAGGEAPSVVAIGATAIPPEAAAGTEEGAVAVAVAVAAGAAMGEISGRTCCLGVGKMIHYLCSNGCCLGCSREARKTSEVRMNAYLRIG